MTSFIDHYSMLGSLLGSINKERALVFLAVRGRGYSREIARYFSSPVTPVQNALDRLETAGALSSRTVGRTVEYELNPKYAGRDQLRALIEHGISLYPAALQESLRNMPPRSRRKPKPKPKKKKKGSKPVVKRAFSPRGIPPQFRAFNVRFKKKVRPQS